MNKADQRDIPDISIIITLYNEKATIPILYEKLEEMLDAFHIKAEVLFVDDGSTDGSRLLLEQIASSDSRVRLVRHEVNKGQHKAIERGFRESTGEILVTMDADLQNDPADIPMLVDKIKGGYDLVCGWRSKRDDHWSKKLKSKVGNYIQQKVTKVKVHDMSCSLRAYRREIVKGIKLGTRHQVGFLPYMISRRTDKIAEVRVRHSKREWGESKYRFFNTLFGVIAVYLKLMRRRRT